MSTTTLLIVLALTGLIGIGAGYALRLLVALGQKGSVELQIKQRLLEAREEAKRIISEGEKESGKLEAGLRDELRLKEEAALLKEKRIGEKETYLDKRQLDIDKEADRIKAQIEEVKRIKERADKLILDREKSLQDVAKLTEEEARAELFRGLEKNHEEDMMVRVQKLEIDGKERLDAKAREILTTAIHRMGNSVHSDVLTSSVPIPSDDIKGKIIGREGRNIRAFERATGVDLIVDDTPGAITLSCFDPVRRNIARVALENLIIDARIQPARIEDAVEKAKEEIGKVMKEKAEQAAYECGIHGLDPRLMSILGRLYFRTSYGQNVLQHSIEMAHIAGVLATELGLDVKVAKTGALLHDIGKAVDHAVQGTHVEIGRRILEKFGVDKRVIQAMQAHHEEYPYETMESLIVQVADSISGGRPGARRDSVENYIKRLQELEAIATSFAGVEKAYAIQAGREVRIFVKPEEISDLQAHDLARNIAMRVENEMHYPGEVKINVIRETRTIEFAH
ncbi:MAG: ribonuclease Y [Candidatus Pacebacteria bacterium]|nr:ribonuclease Y [Candidatus Paceibacterota bacterium]MBP9832379.1 ribonuclease Y [Candidatus Paceibacterota bacterium]